MFGNTVALAGAEKGVPRFEEDPGSGLPGTGGDIVVDFPPHPQTEKTMIDEKKNARVFESKTKLLKGVIQVLLSNNSGSTKRGV
jgi:hypothetical protein